MKLIPLRILLFSIHNEIFEIFRLIIRHNICTKGKDVQEVHSTPTAGF